MECIDYDAAEEGKILRETLEAGNLPFFVVEGKNRWSTPVNFFIY